MVLPSLVGEPLFKAPAMPGMYRATMSALAPKPPPASTSRGAVKREPSAEAHSKPSPTRRGESLSSTKAMRSWRCRAARRQAWKAAPLAGSTLWKRHAECPGATMSGRNRTGRPRLSTKKSTTSGKARATASAMDAFSVPGGVWRCRSSSQTCGPSCTPASRCSREPAAGKRPPLIAKLLAAAAIGSLTRTRRPRAAAASATNIPAAPPPRIRTSVSRSAIGSGSLGVQSLA